MQRRYEKWTFLQWKSLIFYFCNILNFFLAVNGVWSCLNCSQNNHQHFQFEFSLNFALKYDWVAKNGLFVLKNPEFLLLLVDVTFFIKVNGVWRYVCGFWIPEKYFKSKFVFIDHFKCDGDTKNGLFCSENPKFFIFDNFLNFFWR